MLDYINISTIPVFLLLIARILAFFLVTPLFSYRTIPTTFKIGLTVFLAIIIFPTIGEVDVTFDYLYILLVMKEVVVGLSIGLIAYIIVSAIQIAGGFIDFQMGFAVANVIDPQTGAQSPIMGQYLYIFSLLFLLAVNGHHLIIDGIYNSYQMVPIDAFLSMNDIFSTFIIQTFNKMFIIAFQMAIPVVGCLFLVDVALGIIARSVPQLNVFVVGLPLKILVSFLVITLFLPLYFSLARSLFDLMFTAMRDLMIIVGGG